jgi:hypothetical protein
MKNYKILFTNNIMDDIKNDQEDNNNGWSEYFVDTLYGLSELNGKFWGDITASMINNTTTITEVGSNILIKNRDSFCEKVKPAIQKSKEKIVKNLPEDYKKYFE